MELLQIHSIIKIIYLIPVHDDHIIRKWIRQHIHLGANSDGKSYTSVNGVPTTVKEPGSNSYWATSPTTNMVFSELFRGGGTNLGS